jgi:hypothetical protein
MRRPGSVRTSTWILIAVFLLTLVAYLLLRPTPTATGGGTPAAPHRTHPPTSPPTSPS